MSYRAVCNETRSCRWRSWGADGETGKEQRRITVIFKKNRLSVCVRVCVCVCVCVQVCGCFCLLPRSLIWGASIIRAVSLVPHLACERVLWRQTPIHTVAPPAHLDKPARPFIISLVIPELPASDFYLHYARVTCIHISNLNLSALQWDECKRGGGRVVTVTREFKERGRVALSIS